MAHTASHYKGERRDHLTPKSAASPRTKRKGTRFSPEARAIAQSRRKNGQPAWVKGGKRRAGKTFKNTPEGKKGKKGK